MRTPRGSLAQFECRYETGDYKLVHHILSTDEYGLAERHLEGWALDVGAHIGAVTIALALDNPHLRVVAVEPIHENVVSLRRNVALNGLEDRVFVVGAAASRPGVLSVEISYGYIPDAGEAAHSDYQDHTFIGNTYLGEQKRPTRTAQISAVSLNGLMRKYRISEVAALKIDCEGCEWDFLQDPAVTRVQTIFGEMHGITSGEHAARVAPHESRWTPGAHRCNCQNEHLAKLLAPTHRLHIDAIAFDAVRL